ncbi:hypothetical protein BCR39DRAFT_590986 [Naematelia encephala]|uniref:Survival Motor Neuron Gemin2-binding domain-containing protein n=1 Tax=Naematelia encephala TaxID=71784 RepID=A0A1Y2AL99_9TREE|nr:hypothetical protein BCR39DRAFT_590986 [Naematelia encephala]
MSDAEDMQLEIDDEEEQMNGSAPSSALPIIQLSFGNSAGGAWDDRELINAYDTAIDEFHLHHPGPGTWLDKATAALAKGQPLPSAQPKTAAWYKASFTGTAAQLLSEQHMPQLSDEPPSKKPRRENKKSRHQAIDPSNPYTNGGSSSRYNSNREHQQQRGPSPTYAPLSPTMGPASPPWAANGNENENEVGDEQDIQYGETGMDDEEEEDIQEPATYPAGPNYGVQPTGNVSADEAFSYAMTAQYWAGYWMGVAQTKSKPTGTSTTRVAKFAEGEGSGGPTNVLRTRRQFWRETNGTQALRR